MMDGHAPEPSQPPGDGGRHAYLFHGALTVLPLRAVYAPGNGEVYPGTRHERNLSRSVRENADVGFSHLKSKFELELFASSVKPKPRFFSPSLFLTKRGKLAQGQP